MNRLIKFRAWHTQRHEMLNQTPGVADYWHEQELFAALAIGEPIILNQFTGVLDKNGREIYEDDVVAYVCKSDPRERYTGTVKYRNGYFSPFHSTCEDDPRYMLKEFDFEVIGNVYEDNS